MQNPEVETTNFNAGPSLGTCLRVAAFTGGKMVSSRRFRIHQYLPCFHKLAISLNEYGARVWKLAAHEKHPKAILAGGPSVVQEVVGFVKRNLSEAQRSVVATSGKRSGERGGNPFPRLRPQWPRSANSASA
jgi:hypothetical protein